MIRNELQKLFSPLHIIILIVILAIKICVSVMPYTVRVPYSKAVYREYMRELAGQTAAEAAVFIAGESAWMNEELNAEIADGKTVQEQFAVSEARRDADRKKEAFEAVCAKYAYFCEFAENDDPPVFFYDLEWNAFLTDNSPDWLFLLCIITVIVPFFTADCGAIRTMLFASRHGRARLIRVKLHCAWITALALSLLFQAAEIICFIARSGMAWSDAPLHSLQAFSGSRLGLTLCSFMLLRSISRILWSIPVCLLAAYLCVRIRSASFSVLLFAGILLIPALLGGFLPPVIGSMLVGISMNGAVPFQEAENIMLLMINGIAMIVHTVLLSVMTVTCWLQKA